MHQSFCEEIVIVIIQPSRCTPVLHYLIYYILYYICGRHSDLMVSVLVSGPASLLVQVWALVRDTLLSQCLALPRCTLPFVTSYYWQNANDGILKELFAFFKWVSFERHLRTCTNEMNWCSTCTFLFILRSGVILLLFKCTQWEIKATMGGPNDDDDPNSLFCFKFLYMDPQWCAVLQYGLCNLIEWQTNIVWAEGGRGSVSSKYHEEF